MSTPAHLRAISLLQQGRVEAAVDALRRIVELAPGDALAHGCLGHCQIRLGREEEAWHSLTTACRLSDRNAQAFSDLAWLAAKRDQTTVAAQAAERALTLNPGDANARFVAAQMLFAAARFDEGEIAFAAATKAKPALVDARMALGNGAFERGDFPAASRHYFACTQVRSTEVDGWINYGLSLAREYKLSPARAAFERAVALAPTAPKPAVLLALLLRDSGASDAELIPALRRAVVLAPDASTLHLHLASSLFNEQDFRQARVHLDSARRLDPDNLVARWLEFQMPQEAVAADEATRDAFLAHWRAGMADFEALDWNRPQVTQQAGDTATAATNFYLAYLGKPLLEEQTRHADALRKLAQAAGWTRDETAVQAIRRKRRRVAIFASALTERSISVVWSPTLFALDPDEFEIGMFCAETAQDVVAQRWRVRAAHFDSGSRLTAAWIAALQTFAPDVAIFPAIGNSRVAQAVASVRSAPVQATMWAHPVTSGMATIDYFLGADACEPDDAEQHYTERLVRLPRLGVLLDLPTPAPVPAKPSATDGVVRLLCAQSADKLHSGHDDLFARVLQAAPNTRLDIICSKPAQVAAALAARMRPAFEKRSIDFAARCRILPGQTPDAYQHFLHDADVCLDSLDFSGCLTSLDALWRDLPIVTLPGGLMRSRQTAGMLRLLGLDELIAPDIPGYVRIATGLARDSAWRAALTARIRARKAELYGDGGAVEALAAFLRTVEPPSIAGPAAPHRR
jgi:protein O-GlcNAc transferase